MAERLLTALREAVRQAIGMLNSMRDPDAHFLRQGARFSVLTGDASLAYGYNSATISRAPPSPAEITRMEIVLDWLGWLRRKHGTDEFRRIMDWAGGQSVFKLASREDCSQRTILNRIDRSLQKILIEFGPPQNEPVEIIEEPFSADAVPTYFVTEIPNYTEDILNFGNPNSQPRAITGKIYVGGIGFMRNGKTYRDGREKF